MCCFFKINAENFSFNKSSLLFFFLLLSMGVYPFSSPLSAMEGEKAHKPPPRKKRKLNPKEEKKSYLDELPEEIVVCYIFPFVEHEAVKKGKLPPLVFVSKKFYLLFS